MLRVAVIGLGNIGRTHTNVYSKNKDVELVALCDRLTERVDPLARQYGVPAYHDLAEMLRSEKIDAVSPFIDSIARRGVLFERCYAPNIPTHPSFTTMLTGKEAITHDIVNIGGGVPLAGGVRLLPEILKEHGYTTAAVDSMGRHFRRGYFDHHGLYEGNIHVPLILYWPGKLPAGRRVPCLVQNLDLAPTLLDLVGVPDRDAMEGLSLLPAIYGLRAGNYDEVYLSEATWEVKRGLRTACWKFIASIEPDPHGRPMRELYDLQVDPCERRNVIAEHQDEARALQERLEAWVARRLAQTGRTVDPLRAQGRCATGIGTPRSGEVVGTGATPLSKRKGALAANIPAPRELRAPNEARDEMKGVALHGYVKE